LCPGGETRGNTEQLRVYSDSHAAPSPAMKRGQNQSKTNEQSIAIYTDSYVPPSISIKRVLAQELSEGETSG
jgi:hypothetical protein